MDANEIKTIETEKAKAIFLPQITAAASGNDAERKAFFICILFPPK